MRHYGDITKLSAYDLPTVDNITGGSPCQDLSVAVSKRHFGDEDMGVDGDWRNYV